MLLLTNPTNSVPLCRATASMQGRISPFSHFWYPQSFQSFLRSRTVLQISLDKSRISLFYIPPCYETEIRDYLSPFKHPEQIFYTGSNRTFHCPHKEIPSGYFLSARKPASLVTSKLCWFLLSSPWVLNKNATSTKSLTDHEIVWFHFHPACTTLLTNHYVSSHTNKELETMLRASNSCPYIASPHLYSPFKMH